MGAIRQLPLSGLRKELESIVSSLDCTIWEADPAPLLENRPEQYTFQFVSNQAEQMFGYPCAEWLSQPSICMRLIHPEDQHWVIQHCVEATKNCADHEMEYRTIAADGTVMWIRNIISVISKDGTPVKLRGLMIDITDKKAEEERRKQREEQLLQFQSRLLHLAKRKFTDLASELRAITELAAQTLEVERVSVWFFDFTHTEILCQDLYQLNEDRHEAGIRLQAKDYPRYFQALEESRTIAAHKAQLDIRTSEFTENYLRVYGITSMMDIPIRLHGRVVGIICHEHTGPARRWSLEEQEFAASIADMASLAIETHERRRAERSLRHSEERFRKTIDGALDAVVIINRDGLITSWNPQAEKLFGWKSDEVLHQDMATTIIPERYRERHKEGMKKFLATGKGPILNQRAELSALHKDGHEFPVELTVIPLETGDGFAFSAFIQDITERKTHEQQIQKYTDELRRSNKELEQFAHVASHDLQEPLRKIVTFGSRLTQVQPEELSEKTRDYIKRMEIAAKRMQALVEDLLDYSRVSAKPMHFETVDLNRILKNVLSDLDERIRDSHTEIKVAKLPMIEAEANQMHALLQNILSNAMKFRKKGEPLTINITSTNNKKGPVVIRIQDNGIGMESNYLTKIFEPFYRLHGRTEYDGTGMGLAICQKIIRRHHGNISVESTVDEGSTFTLTLPRKQEEVRP